MSPEIEKAPQPQRPDLGIEAIEPDNALLITKEQLPWLNADITEVPTVKVSIENSDMSFRYGSAVSGNHSIEKLANNVPSEQSLSAERGMFKALPLLLEQKSAANIERVTYVDSQLPVYKTNKAGKDAPRLFFTLFNDEKGSPVVLKLGVALHKKQEELTSILTSRKRRKRDG